MLPKKNIIIEKISSKRFFPFFAFISINLIATLFHWYTQTILGIYSPFLSFFASVALSTWLGGVTYGVLSTLITLYATIYLFPRDFGTDMLHQIIMMILYLLESWLICYVVDKARRSDQKTHYETREKIFTKIILDNQKKLKKAQEEIFFRDEFLSIASHELKNPLTSTLLQLQMSIYNIRNVSLANFSVQNLMTMLQSAEEQTKRLSKMINDLSNVSLITTGKFELDLEETDLAKIVHDTIGRFSNGEKKYKDSITLSVERETLGLWDKTRLEQVVTNLLLNAVKYGNNNPVKISVKSNNNAAFLEVKDQGIGIPKDALAKIFLRFERGENSKLYQGLGVGLYISNQIVKAHGGKITVESTLGKGSTFRVELPKKKTK